MTAPDAVPEGTTVEQLAAALRAYHDVAPQRAAVELLIAHNQGSAHWLRREPFRECVEWMPAEDDDDEPMAAVEWGRVAALLGTGQRLHDTGSEWAVLGVAVALAIGSLADAASSCDVHNRRLVAAAVVDALGLSWGDVMMAQR